MGPTPEQLTELHDAVLNLRDKLTGSETAEALTNSVLRPLQELIPDRSAPTAAAGTLWELTLKATQLRVLPGAPAQLLEATAGLQTLACAEDSDRVAELQRIQADLPGEIRTATNGPYLVTNVGQLRDYLGYPIAPQPQLALCRCGASKTKPYCDGAHAETGFVDAKSPDRVPDRRDAYVGLQVEVFDNRGICQHSGLCTDRLATVFRQGKEPFVAPSGGRMDEIVRAVRDCPSGALSYGIDGVEARDEVDRHGTREPAIEVTKDGPYRITGGVPLHDNDGDDVPRNEGASLEHYALCRCGHSQNKPFCSGMHWYVDFHDPLPSDEPTIFEWCGGLPALTRMARLFYEKHVPQDPLLAPLFGSMSADHPQRVAAWLGEVFGGPKAYSGPYGGYSRMVNEHVGKGISEEQRARWVQLLLLSATEAGLPNDPEFRAAFSSYVEWGSRLAVENSQANSRPPQHMPMPNWHWTTAAGPPGSRISALPSDEPAEKHTPVLPAADEPVSFEHHIRTLFRPFDRKSMSFAFDLWSYDDVRAHADAIHTRLQAGTMPCDTPWPPEYVATYERWLATGTRP
ncbi:CDGSH iron-sulfur domain-containing protein [Kribbella sp. NPDC026611]|uniref:CDGSH iron-sulfur domain-containing protein n=1 Tax=Kribbella sp. NPDC026611 TaxID=3154911 RepID=UPI00340B51DE